MDTTEPTLTLTVPDLRAEALKAAARMHPDDAAPVQAQIYVGDQLRRVADAIKRSAPLPGIGGDDQDRIATIETPAVRPTS